MDEKANIQSGGMLAFIVILFLLVIPTIVVVTSKVKDCEAEINKAKLLFLEEELQKRSISLYIKKHTPKIPVEVAYLIANNILDAAEKNNLNPSLIVGLIQVESDFNPMASSHKGALGLMQVVFKVWKDEYELTAKEDLYDIATNIRVGSAILAYYINSKGDVSAGLNAYNGQGSNGNFDAKVYASVGRFVIHKTYNEKTVERKSKERDGEKSNEV